jgi:alanine dehydrogenase
VTWPKQGANIRRVKVPLAPNGRYVGLMLLFSCESGEPLAIMPDGMLQRIRVGATNGLGVKYLARKDAKAFGILGSGWQEGTQLMAVCAVRDIDTIRCFSPDRDRRTAFAQEMSSILGITVDPASQPEDAVGEADIVMCATNSIENIFFARWIRPGVHISSIKLPEIEIAAIRRADRFVIHTHDTKPLHVTAKDLKVPEIAEAKGWRLGEGIDFQGTPTLADVITGAVPGRRSDREVTCFHQQSGIRVTIRRGWRRGISPGEADRLGRELPTEWFTQDVHP